MEKNSNNPRVLRKVSTENTKEKIDVTNTQELKPQEKKSQKVYPGIEDEGVFGYFSFNPRFLQIINNPTGYLIVFGFFLITQSMLVNGYLNAVLTTLERRFGFESSETGLIVVGYDIGYFSLCLFVSFYANRAHRPKILAVGSMSFALGCLIFSIAHFTTSNYTYEDGFSDLCDPSIEPSCETSEEDENLHSYLYLFIFAMLLQGVGCIPLYTVGFSIIEDSVPKGKSALFLGIANALTILGPVIGYMFGGYFLTIYVDFDTVNTEEITLVSGDPRWVGAWWIGFLLAALMAFVLVAIPMLGFPKQFPGSAKHRAERVSEVPKNAGAEITEKEDFGKSMWDMTKSMYAMAKNPTFIFTTLAGCSEGFIISAYTAFLPKFIESQFNQTPTRAALYAGMIAIPGGVFGNIIAGLTLKKFELRTPQILKMCITCCCIVFILSPIGLLTCSDPIIAGVNVAYDDSQLTHPPSNLTSACNSDCGCQEKYFSPVCGADNVNYFSACLAGCTAEETISSTKVFYDCACIPTNETGKPDATSGFCNESCKSLAPFLGVFFFIVLTNFIVTTPALLVILRCVPDSQKTFAVGVQWWVVRALGSIPGPIVFGAVFDASCVLWQQLPCGDGTGSCWLNDSNDVAIYLLIATMGCKVVSGSFFCLAHYFYKLPEADESKLAGSINSGFELGLIEDKGPDQGDLNNLHRRNSSIDNYTIF